MSKNILKGLLIAGTFAIASTSPTFAKRLVPALVREMKFRHNRKKHRKKMEKIYNSFYYMRRKGLIKMRYQGKQLHISLTKEGRKLAKKYSIDDLEIKKPRKWDKKWRVLMFDIKEEMKVRREALRGKLKELNFYQLQKSVWVCPYDFDREAETLRSFFGFNQEEMTTLIASKIENEKKLMSYFSLGKAKK